MRIVINMLLMNEISNHAFTSRVSVIGAVVEGNAGFRGGGLHNRLI
jgi:hypothetical protein